MAYLPDRFLGEMALRQRKPYQDFLSRVKLWEDFVVAFRPYVSAKLAIWLAELILIGMLTKLLLGYLLELAIELSAVEGALEKFVQEIIWFGASSNGMTIIALSVLILIVNYVSEFEQKYRYKYAVQQRQNEIRKVQEDIDIPATQK
jgi:hypothetical protein